MNLSDADHAAAIVQKALDPVCRHCQVAGSTRRRSPFPKDLEFVLVLDPLEMSRWPAVLRSLGRVRKGSPAGRHISIGLNCVPGINLDLFIATRENAGWIFFVRTGPPDFVKGACMRWTQVSGGGHSRAGFLRQPDGTAVPTQTETDVWTLLKRRPLSPPARIGWSAWAGLLENVKTL